MENINTIKVGILGSIGVIGGIVANIFGGWDMLLKILVTLMALDYVTGLVVAGVFHASSKSINGALESKAGWKGLCKKGVTLVIVLVAVQVDKLTGSQLIRDGVVIAYAVNEAISILENADAMGVWVPDVLKTAIGAIQKK